MPRTRPDLLRMDGPAERGVTCPPEIGSSAVRVTIARIWQGGGSREGRRHTPEQVVRKLREADRLLAEGRDLQEVCRLLEVSIQTYQRWRSQYKAMRPEDVVRLKQLEKENARLKRLLAEKELDNDMLREVARGNW
jgi:transposase-like protein